MSIEEAAVKHEWHITRTTVARPDGERRLYQAYQLILRRTSQQQEGTQRQAQGQSIEQQLQRLRTYMRSQGWEPVEEHVYLDPGYSGASLSRPGLDALRDRAALADFDVLLVTEPSRLARKYIHQALLVEELQSHGCRVEFVDRPMSEDPHDQLLLQIRGAVAEYERTLITERMRRGRLAKVRAGQLLPWPRPPFGYDVDPQRPRDPAGVRLHEYEAAVVREIYAWYLEPGATLSGIADRLSREGVARPRGEGIWYPSTVRGILSNPLYKGSACANRTRLIASRVRASAMMPVGKGRTNILRSQEEWIPIRVPAIVSEEVWELVQAKLTKNQQNARRNNKSHEYLLRALVSCGTCRLSAGARTVGSNSYYACRRVKARPDEPKHRSHIPAGRLDELVWEDLCEVLTKPELLADALERARGGQWLPQELRSRQEGVKAAIGGVDRQGQRLLDAYLAGVLELPEFERKRGELDATRQVLQAQARQLEQNARQHIELAALVWISQISHLG